MTPARKAPCPSCRKVDEPVSSCPHYAIFLGTPRDCYPWASGRLCVRITWVFLGTVTREVTREGNVICATFCMDLLKPRDSNPWASGRLCVRITWAFLGTVTREGNVTCVTFCMDLLKPRDSNPWDRNPVTRLRAIRSHKLIALSFRASRGLRRYRRWWPGRRSGQGRRGLSGRVAACGSCGAGRA